MYSISVIVPLHNSKKYIQECIESILNQTQKDIEIICVDSSTDETTDMIRQYRKSDDRIRLIEDSNTGYGHKINVGIQLAKGEYMAIVESDDYIAKNMLEDLYYVAKEEDADFVMANFEEYIDTRFGRMFSQFNRLKDKRDYNRVISLRQEPHLMPRVECNIWSGIYKMDFLREKKIQCNESEGASYQDTGFATLVTLLSERVCFLEECYYKYRKDNEGSSVKSDKKYKCIVDEFIWLQKRLEELGCNSEIDVAFFKETRLRAFFWNYSRLSKEYQEKFLCLDYVKESAIDFDERILKCKIPEKAIKLKILSGDSKTRETENMKQLRYVTQYKELLRIFLTYKKIVIVCSGRLGQSVYRLMKAADCMADICVCDNFIRNKIKEFDGRDILSVEEAVAENKTACFIIANRNRGSELNEQLIMLGVEEKDIYLYEENFISSNVGVLYNVIKNCEGSINGTSK